jgi:hypothetical protein
MRINRFEAGKDFVAYSGIHELRGEVLIMNQLYCFLHLVEFGQP